MEYGFSPKRDKVQLFWKVGYPALSPGKKRQQYLLCSLNPQDQDHLEERLPLKLMLCIDTSGSMMGHPLELLIKTLETLIEKLGPQDLVGMVTFSDRAKLISELRPMDLQGKAFFQGVLSTLQALGSTNMSAGLNLAFRQLEAAQNQKGQYLTHLILLSDGLPTRGERSPNALAEIIEDNKRLASVSCLGFGPKHDEDLLNLLARKGNGSYTYIESSETIIYAFAKELGSIMSIVGKEVQFSILPTPGVSILRLINPLEMRYTSKGLTVDVPDLIAGYNYHLIFELQVDVPEGTSYQPLASVELSYTIPGNIEQNKALHLQVFCDVSPEGSSLDPEVATRIALIEASQKREEALSLADRELKGQAVQILRELYQKLSLLDPPREMEEEFKHWLEQLREEISILSSQDRYQQLKKSIKSSMPDPSGIFRYGNTSLISLNTTQRNLINKLMLKAIGVPHAYLRVERVPQGSSIQVGQNFPFLGEITIGRNGEIKLDHPSVASIHLRMIATPKGYLAIDMPTANPPLLDGQPILKPTRISDKQKLQIGEFILSFHLGLAPEIERKKPS